ncbi:MAG: hypothetical protein ABF242_02950 [Flavobacteriales bacterium]
MVRIITVLFLILSLGTTCFSQQERSHNVGINIAPLLGTTYEIGYEFNSSSGWSFNLYSGLTRNSRGKGLIDHTKDAIRFETRSGYFVKLGSHYNFRKSVDNFAFFIGGNIVYGYSIEQWNQGYSSFSKVGDNLGINSIIGLSSPYIKKVRIDLGFQIGTLIINNLISYKSYMPGMGIAFGNINFQGILRMKYRIN